MRERSDVLLCCSGSRLCERERRCERGGEPGTLFSVVRARFCGCWVAGAKEDEEGAKEDEEASPGRC